MSSFCASGRPVDVSRSAQFDLSSRTLAVRNIPAGTQEAIVQQTFEKHAAVSAVLMEEGATEGTVEFTTAAVSWFPAAH